jgi:hypothetical protein
MIVDARKTWGRPESKPQWSSRNLDECFEGIALTNGLLTAVIGVQATTGEWDPLQAQCGVCGTSRQRLKPLVYNLAFAGYGPFEAFRRVRDPYDPYDFPW